MQTQFGNWIVALGVEWLLPKNKSEIRLAKKSRSKQSMVFVSTDVGDWIGFHAAGVGKVYSGALLVAMVEPNAVVYCPINEEMSWICAISEGMPVVGYDEVLPTSEARNKAKGWSNLFANADIIGELSGAKATVQDVLSVLEQELESKSLSKKQLAGALLVNNSISVVRIVVMSSIVFGVMLVGWGVKTYKETQERKERDRLSLKEAAKRSFIEKLDYERAYNQQQQALKNLAIKVASEKVAIRERVNPALMWDALTKVRQSLPPSMYGYKQQSYECGTDVCKVEWLGVGKFTNAAGKLSLPGVERSLSNDLKATSSFDIKRKRDVLPRVNAANIEELAFLTHSKFSTQVQGFALKPAQPVTVEGIKGVKESEVIGYVGKWHMTIQGATALLQVAEITRLMSDWPIRLTNIRYQPMASSVDLDGEYVFVIE